MIQLFVFIAFAYFISWVIWIPLYFPALGLSAPWAAVPYNHAIGGFGPMLAAIITLILFKKKETLKLLAQSSFSIRQVVYILLALISPFALQAIAVSINFFITHQTANPSDLFIFSEFPKFNFLQYFIYNLIFFGFGEELGWRGFALPVLQRKMSPLVSSIALTFFWALWHWPLFLYRPGYTSMDSFGIIGWLFSLLTGSILLTWFYNSSKRSLLVCAIFHATIDIAFTVQNKTLIGYMGMLITVWGIMTGAWMWRKNQQD